MICAGPDCTEPLTHRDQKTYCSVSCSNRGRAEVERLSERPAHGHRITVESVRSDGEDWRVLYGCRDCPATWRGPISVEDLETVECEAEQGRAA